MGKRVISIKLDTDEINRAIRELEQYKKDFNKKVDLFRVRFAEEISKVAQKRFNSSGVDDLLKGGTRQADVSVSVSDNGAISLIIADGEDAVWCEFGAGVYHNGSVGNSPNPYGSEKGLTIGSYGKGLGKQPVWGYYTDPDDKNSLVLTHGTKATMPLYNAVQDVVPRVISIAREVFG
jgi:hypothetical protein